MAGGIAVGRGGVLTFSGTCTIISRFASWPSDDASSPLAVTPEAWTVLSRSAVSGARSPPELKNSRWPQLFPPTVFRALSTTVRLVPWRVTSSVSTAGFLRVDW